MDHINNLEATESSAFGNRSYPMNIAFMDAYKFQEVLEKLEPTEQEAVDLLTQINHSLYSKDTELGKKLVGDSILAQEGFAKITNNDSGLIQLVGLFLASDALKEADVSLIGESRLTLHQLHGGGDLLADVYNEIIKSNIVLPNKDQQNKFNEGLKATVELYREKGILHTTEGKVKEAINK